MANTVNTEEIVKILSLKKTGKKGWYSGPCPYCGSNDKFGVHLEGEAKTFNCFRASCNKSGGLIELLRHINRTDLAEGIKFQDISKKLESKLKFGEDSTIIIPPKISLPIGFKRVYEDSYLQDRGIIPQQFKKYTFGRTIIDSVLKRDYIIVGITQNNEIVGYLSRSKKSKKEIDEYNNSLPEGEDYKKIQRYRNAEGVDFENILFGIDECTPNTKTVILVEGFFGKTNLENILELDNQEEIKVCITFGKNMNQQRINLLLSKGVENIILFDDEDAIVSIKDTSMLLEKYFDVKIFYFNKEGRDSGDITLEEFNELELQSPYLFHNNYVNKKKLR